MTSEVVNFFIAFAILLFAFGLISQRISNTVITAPMIFVIAGFLLSPAELDLVELSSSSSLVLTVAELALILTLFSDASTLEFHVLLREEKLPKRLLFVALPLIIAFGIIIAAFLFKDLTFAEAGLIGAMLSPTDAGLGQAIVTNPKVPLKIRQSLNVESGLNDGGSIPFFLFFLILVSGEMLNRPVGTLIFLAFEQIGLGLLVGVVVGFVGGKLSNRAFLSGWTSGLYRKIGFMALAVVCWLGADMIGGSGFIAAFVGGFVSRVANSSGHTEEEAILTEAEGSILSFAVFFIFGIIVATKIFAITWPILLYSVLSLTLIRMIPVAISVMGMKLNPKTILFLGWFGPRGLASIVLLLIVIEDTSYIGGSEIVSLVVITTVILSVFIQGATAGPGSRIYARAVESFPEGSPEKENPGEFPVNPDRY